MSSHVIMTFHSKTEAVKQLRDLLSGLQDRIIEGGALTASLLQDDEDATRFIEVDVWQSAAEYGKFVEAAEAEGRLKPIEDLLLSPHQVEVLDTVKYSCNRQR
jgi:quinol monooxygenase YgiN